MGGGRAARHRGQLRRAEAVHVGEDDQRAVLGAEHAMQQCQRIERERRPLVGRGWRRGDPLDGPPQPLRAAQGVQRAVPRDPEQPRLRVLDAVEVVARLPRREERLLEQVLGERAVAHDVDEELPEASLVRREQPLDVGPGPPGVALHDLDHAR